MKTPLPQPYSVSDGKVMYEDMVIQGADPETFTVVPDALTGDEYTPYSIDKNRAYYYSVVLQSADPKTFVAYLPEHVEERKAHYAKDCQTVYMNAMKLDLLNPNTFKPLRRALSKDDKRVFRHHFPVRFADAKSFRVIEDDLDTPDIKAIDKNFHYSFVERTDHEHRFFPLRRPRSIKGIILWCLIPWLRAMHPEFGL